MKLQRGLKFQETGAVVFSLSLEPRFLLNFPFSLYPSLNKCAFCGWLLAVPFPHSLGWPRLLPFEIGLGNESPMQSQLPSPTRYLKKPNVFLLSPVPFRFLPPRERQRVGH